MFVYTTQEDRNKEKEQSRDDRLHTTIIPRGIFTYNPCQDQGSHGTTSRGSFANLSNARSLMYSSFIALGLGPKTSSNTQNELFLRVCQSTVGFWSSAGLAGVTCRSSKSCRGRIRHAMIVLGVIHLTHTDYWYYELARNCVISVFWTSLIAL